MKKQPFKDDTVAYKGYLIKPSSFLGEGFRLEKEGQHIGYSPTVKDAKETIDKYLT